MNHVNVMNLFLTIYLTTRNPTILKNCLFRRFSSCEFGGLDLLDLHL